MNDGTGRPVIRTMAETDVRAVTALGLQLGYPVDEGGIAQRLRRYRSDPAHLLLVSEIDGAVVGWVHALERALLQEPLLAELGGLVVDDARRGIGVGAALVDAVESWARARGCHGLWLHSSLVRDGAHGFYPALGFDRIKTSHVYYRAIPPDR